MADKAISELVSAEQITPLDMFVLEQNGTAKKLTGQVLLNWLTAAADGHGGIQSIAKIGTNVLADTYRITLADTTVFDFVVTNGRGIVSLQKTGTAGLVDTYTFTYNDGTTAAFTVANGAKGDKGDNATIWVKYASQKPTASSHSFGDNPDAWIGIASGHLAEAPTDWQQYTWYQWKGDKGDTGAAATLNSSAVEYQVSDSGTIIPSGAWSASVPVVAQGKYLWTRTTQTFNTGSPVVSYSVSRMGMDGSGSVSSVAGISPDENGDVPLTAEYFGALSINGGVMNGGLDMNGQKLNGLNAPTEDDEAATKGYVDNAKPNMTGYATETYVNSAVKKAAPRNLMDNSDFTDPVNQGGLTRYAGDYGYCIDRWTRTANGTVTLVSNGVQLEASSAGNAMISNDVAATPNMVGKSLTLAYCTGGGVVGCVTFSITTIDVSSNVALSGNIVTDGNSIGYVYLLPNRILRIQLLAYKSKTAIFRWAALYEGAYSIDTLPEYKSKGKQVEALNCGAIPGPIDLLWENASPTSAFEEQTIDLDFSLYNWVLVEAIFSTEYSERTTLLAPVIVGNTYSIMMNRSGSTVARRFFTLTETGVDFANGASGSSNGAKYMMPVRIYGVKG